MIRTNVYLDERQLRALRGLSEREGQPVAALVREAVDRWLEGRGARVIDHDEWTRRFDSLFARRDRIARDLGFDDADVERDVREAVREVRRTAAARRR
jgi:hypothetical protein